MSLNTLLYAVVIATICSARLSASASFNFTIEPSDHVVAIGQPLLLNCQAQYSGPGNVVISWKNNDAWLLHPANKPWKQLANSSLYYSSIPAQSIGTFICGATVYTGTQLIIISRTATVQAAYIKSQYLGHPVNATKRLGETATFDCTIEESLPYASIQWQKDGNLFTQGEVAGPLHIPGTKATSSALSVKSITFSSAGWYGCVAINPLLPSQPQSSKRAYLTVLPSLDKPHFGVHPTNMIVPEHLSAIMQCQILGVPPPMISWTMNGQLVKNVSDRYILSNGSLFFAAPVNRSYAGQYVCSGTNSAGSISSGAVFFRVAYFDFAFVENPVNQTAVVGDAVSMDCLPPVSFPVQVTIQWYHKYQLITPGGSISIDSSGSLKFTAIKKSDEGMYFCDGTNSDLQVTRTSELAYVTVLVPPTFQIQPRDTNVTQGSPLTLHCQAIGFPLPTLTWQKDGQPVDTNHVTLLSNGSLHISTTVVQDAGKFSCNASNVAGSTTVSADVVIYVPPSLVSPASNATKTVGESVKFKCSFSGIPNPDIQWFYTSGGSRVQLTQTDHYVITAGSLEIRQILKSVEGMYICKAINVAGSLESSVYLRVKVPASLDMNPVNMTVNESSSASFRCNASGDPKPVITWLKGGMQLAAGGRIVIGGDSLTILNTIASDAGQYSCNVSNGLSSHVGIAHLLVQVAPDITSFLVPRLVQLGMNATLTCEVSGIPQPRITWYRNNVLLSVTSSVFVIGHVSEADGGVYNCIASNAAGRESKHGNLTIQVAPSAPFPISATPESSTVIQLSWRPGFDGHSSITGYKLEMRRESGTYVVLEENIFATSYTVRNLDPYVTYTFKISARNAVGLSPGATVTNRTLEDAPSPPTNMVAVSLNATAISITWSGPAKPNGRITRYEIQYNAVNSSDVTSDVLSANQIPGLKTLIGNLKPFTRYQFRIRAATGEMHVMWGNYSAAVEEITGEAAPESPPQDIQLQVLSADSIFVKWKSVPSEFTNGNVRKYVIFVKAVGPYRFSDAKNFSTDTSLNFTLRQLFPWTIYNVSVQAFTVQAGPESPWEQARTLEAVPGPPSNVTLVSDSQHSVVVLIAQPLPLMRNGIIVGYTVFYRESNMLPDSGYLSVSTTASSVTLVNLTVFTEYSVKVAASTSVGIGDESEVKTVVTQEGVPGTVDDVTATVVDHDTITITWRAPKTPNGRITQYNITYNTADENASRSLTTDGELTVDINNLIPNTTYYIFVTAKTSKGFGRPGKTVNATTRILPPPTAMPTEPQTTSPEESNITTQAVPGGTEKRTGGLGEDQLIIIIVCVGIIVLFLFIAAVYFLGCRRVRDQKAGTYKRSKKRRDFRSGFEMDGQAYPGFPAGSAVLDVQEEPSIADTNFSSDSFDSDWNSSVASPSPVKLSHEYADAADSATPYASDRSPLANLRNKKASIVSQDSQYDQPYSSVEELGGGFGSFSPLPPIAFRSSPIDERHSESPGSRKSFTNNLYNPANEEGRVNAGEGSRASESYQNKDVSGMQNKGYDSDEELDQHLAASLGKNSTPNPAPPNLEELYAKVDKTKKKTFRKKEVPSSSDTESNQSTTLNDSFAKPDKSKKTFREVSSDQQGNQASRWADGPGHEPVVVYDERTNFNAEPKPADSHPGAEKHDAKSVGESTFSSDTITVSDLNSSEAAEPVRSEDLIDLNLELPQANDNEELPIQDPVPRSPSPFTLRNKKISLGSQDSLYDQPYTNLEEIDAGATPVPDFTPPPPPTFGSTVDEAPPEEQPKVLDVAPTISRSSFPNEPYGVVDKSEEEAVVMEVKEIKNMPDDKEAANTINDFDEVLNGLLGNEYPTEPDDRHNSFTSSSAYDSTVLMF